MADTQLVFDILARDRASPAFSRAGAAAERFEKRLKALAKFSALGAAGVAALAPSLGAATVAAAGAATAGAALAQGFGVLKVATMGVGDALSAMAEGDAEKLQEALKKLSPAARDFVEAMRPIGQQLGQVRHSIQEAFFSSGITPAVQRLADTYMPLLEQAGTQTASMFGRLADQASKAMSAPAFRADMAKIVGTNQVVLENLGKAAGNVGEALRHLLVAGAPVAEWLSEVTVVITRGVATGVERLRTGLEALAAGWRGQTQSGSGFIGFMNRAGTVLRTVADWVQANVLPALRSLGDWVKTHVIPALRNAAEEWFPRVKEGLSAIADAIERNKPQLKLLAEALGQMAGVVIEHVIPALAALEGQRLKALYKAIALVIGIIGAAVDALLGLSSTALGAISKVLHGFELLAAAAGKLPGPLGEPFRRAAERIREARGRVDNLKSGIDNLRGKSVTVDAKTAGALGRIRDLQKRLKGIPDETVNVTIKIRQTGSGAVAIRPGGRIFEADGGLVGRYAAGGAVDHRFPRGGMVRGPGTATSDSIPAMLSNGEFVMRAAAVRHFGVAFMEAVNQMRIPRIPAPAPARPAPVMPAAGGGVQIQRPILIQLVTPDGQVLQQQLLKWKRESGQLTLGL